MRVYRVRWIVYFILNTNYEPARVSLVDTKGPIANLNVRWPFSRPLFWLASSRLILDAVELPYHVKTYHQQRTSLQILSLKLFLSSVLILT